MSSIQFSPPSQTYASAPGSAPLQSSASISNGTKSATVKKKAGSSGRLSVEGPGHPGTGRMGGMSPLNPKRGGSTSSSGLVSAGVSIGGAVASMNSAAGLGSMRAMSPPPGGTGRKRVLGGIRKGTSGGGNG